MVLCNSFTSCLCPKCAYATVSSCSATHKLDISIVCTFRRRSKIPQELSLLSRASSNASSAAQQPEGLSQSAPESPTGAGRGVPWSGPLRHEGATSADALPVGSTRKVYALYNEQITGLCLQHQSLTICGTAHHVFEAFM